MKKIRVILLLVPVLLLEMFVFDRSVLANPIPNDQGNAMNPLSLNETSVYFSAETVDVTFSDVASIKASYTFKNDSVDSITLPILLPFISKPSNLSVRTNNTEIPYTWQTVSISKNITDYTFKDEFSAASFDLTFSAHEQKTISVVYSREYVKYDSGEEINYDFAYLVGTGAYWNHNIDSAEFIFRVPESMGIKCKNDEHYQMKAENGYCVASRKFENWDFKKGISNGAVSFYWSDAYFFSEKLVGIVQWVGVIVLFFSFIIFLASVIRSLINIKKGVQLKKSSRIIYITLALVILSSLLLLGVSIAFQVIEYGLFFSDIIFILAFYLSPAIIALILLIIEKRYSKKKLAQGSPAPNQEEILK